MDQASPSNTALGDFLPPPPDFWVCDEYYGSALDLEECSAAVNQIPRGMDQVPWFQRGRSQFVLPFQKSAGGCKFGEAPCFGPVTQAPSIMFESPEALFRLGAFLCDTCVSKERTGGFATHGLRSAAQWAQENSPPIAWRSLPAADATFFTVTVSGPSNKRFYPGNTDPTVALAIGHYISDGKVDPSDRLGELQRRRKVVYWNEKAQEMVRGTATNWWSLEPLRTKDEMVYQCDSSLGRPSANDCATINWQQIATQSDTLKMGLETVFFHVNTCYLAISATVAIVLNWNQIRLAVSALLNTCVQNPFQAAQGGRAYFGLPTYQGSTQRSKRQSANLTGWNALPPHVNITIFEQTQPWINSVEELRTCTWQAAVNRRPVASCASR